MAQVLIRNLPERVIEAQRARAETHGRSLKQDLRDDIEWAAPYTPEEGLAAALPFQSLTPGVRSDPVEAVREAIERDRRRRRRRHLSVCARSRD